MISPKGGDPWGRIGAVEPSSLADPALQLHWAAQLVAAAGQTFAEPRPDDSHRAMSWSDTHSALVGAAFAGPYPFRVALRPLDLTLLLIDRTDQTLGALPLGGRPRSEGYDWLALAMATYLGGAPPHIERPEYDVPTHPVERDDPFRVADQALAVLDSLYRGAAELLAEVAEGRSGASEVRCWPHHFDIATVIAVGDTDQTIGAGLAPMGGGYGSWYWYVTPRPYPEAASLPELAGPGAWHTKGWTGAVLPGNVVTGEPRRRRRRLVRAFLSDAIEAAGRALTLERDRSVR